MATRWRTMPPTPIEITNRARGVMTGAYDTRETVEAAIDYVLTAKPLSAGDREQVIEDSQRGAPRQRSLGRERQA
jgi:hypothetical protein